MRNWLLLIWLKIPYKWVVFVAFMFFCFSLAFDDFIMMCLSIDLFAFTPFEFVDLWKCRFISFIKFGKLLAVIFSKVLLAPFPCLYSPGTPYMCWYMSWCPTGLLGSVYWFSFFFLLRLENFRCLIFNFTNFFFFCLIKSAIELLWWICHFSYCSFQLSEFIFGSFY